MEQEGGSQRKKAQHIVPVTNVYMGKPGFSRNSAFKQAHVFMLMVLTNRFLAGNYAYSNLT